MAFFEAEEPARASSCTIESISRYKLYRLFRTNRDACGLKKHFGTLARPISVDLSLLISP